MNYIMNKQEFNMRQKFADTIITGWKGKINVKGCEIRYTKKNARFLVFNMTDSEFAKAKTNPKLFIETLNPPCINLNAICDTLWIVTQHLIGIFAAIAISYGVEYITQSEILAILAAFVVGCASTAYIQMKLIFPYDRL